MREGQNVALPEQGGRRGSRRRRGRRRCRAATLPSHRSRPTTQSRYSRPSLSRQRTSPPSSGPASSSLRTFPPLPRDPRKTKESARKARATWEQKGSSARRGLGGRGERSAHTDVDSSATHWTDVPPRLAGVPSGSVFRTFALLLGGPGDLDDVGLDV